MPVKKIRAVYLVTHDYLDYDDNYYSTDTDSQVAVRIFRSRSDAEEYAKRANEEQIHDIISDLGPGEVERLKKDEDTDWATTNLYEVSEMKIY